MRAWSDMLSSEKLQTEFNFFRSGIMQGKPQENVSFGLLDGLSKLAVVSTLILGFAYLSGYVYNWVF